MELSNDEIMKLMNTDLLFAIAFIIDNNPDAVIDNARREGIKISTPEEALAAIQSLLNSGNILKAQTILKVPYLDAVDNYTGGHQMHIQERQESKYKREGAAPENGPLKLTAGAILSIVNAVGGSIWGQSGEAGNSQSQADAAAAAAAKKEKNQQNLLIGISIGFAVILTVVIVIATKK